MPLPAILLWTATNGRPSQSYPHEDDGTSDSPSAQLLKLQQTVERMRLLRVVGLAVFAAWLGAFAYFVDAISAG